MSNEILALARGNAFLFTQEFMDYLPENLHVYNAFEREAFRVIQKGRRHYSAKTILEVLRHHSALSDGSEWKLNNNTTPYFARLFALANPANADLFEFRKAARKEAA